MNSHHFIRYITITELNGETNPGCHLHCIVQYNHKEQTQQNVKEQLNRFMKHLITDEASELRAIVVKSNKKNLDFYMVAGGYFTKVKPQEVDGVLQPSTTTIINQHNVDEGKLLTGGYAYEALQEKKVKREDAAEEAYRKDYITEVQCHRLMIQAYKTLITTHYKFYDSETDEEDKKHRVWIFASLQDNEQIDKCFEYLLKEGYAGMLKHTATFRRNAGKYWQSFVDGSAKFTEADVHDGEVVDLENFILEQRDARPAPLTYGQKQYKIKLELKAQQDLMYDRQRLDEYRKSEIRLERQRLAGLHGLTKSQADDLVFDDVSEATTFDDVGNDEVVAEESLDD